MTAHDLLGAAVAALAVTLVAAALVAVAAKAARVALDRRRSSHEHHVRPHVLDVLAGGPLPSELVAIGRQGRDAAVERLLLAAVTRVRGESRAAAVAELHRRGAADRARRRLGHRRAVARARAAEALGLLGGADDVPALARLLSDPSPPLRWVAAQALGHLGTPEAVDPLLDHAGAPRGLPAGQAVMALWLLGPAAVEPLRRGLTHPSATARAASADLLGHLDALRAGDELLAALASDPDPTVRAAAAGALGRIGSPRAGAALAAALGDPDPGVARRAVVALGRLAEPAHLTALVPLVGADDHDTALAATRALVDAGPVGRRLLGDVTGPGSDHAAAALAVADVRDRARRGPAVAGPSAQAA